MNNELSKREKFCWICSHLLLTALLLPMTTSIYAVRYPFRVRTSFSKENEGNLASYESFAQAEAEGIRTARPVEASNLLIEINAVTDDKQETKIELVERQETSG